MLTCIFLKTYTFEKTFQALFVYVCMCVYNSVLLLCWFIFFSVRHVSSTAVMIGQDGHAHLMKLQDVVSFVVDGNARLAAIYVYVCVCVCN